ncbi:ribosome recycling factor [methanotrophic endosymbiont of Bathymodiolus puteoserpentis (Logatchev)]|jgi:ribosome recycling factor|uniref:ribosome recycling factor n=1 Tax=methanotrophic endosymbiont of Bathymodiolus puteoserpentis (Logatchev) TaxID=343235 RepID=UPI00086F59C8|nr:ribosome recycling factor [methanotrophic endosymbiont of Bathymodiolus puteoserpentis (Logatchev)]SCN47130.1 Ribosome recycling factor [methanotrophic endosymbiont of Bathymodiolus azoricus (Menez Gwen)]SHE20146.1 Ribosome recycling factor [methanotrophic endosymbiont of Bathymodiolus puteoserpentis (Logatchev)]
MINDIEQDAASRMGKSIEALKKGFTKIRTGRAHPSLLDQVVVSYYGADTPLSQVANVSIDDSRTLAVTPWERGMIQAIEKAIMASDLGLNPVTNGNIIRVPLPMLTEERRRDLVKVVKAEAENGRVSIRNIRRDANNEIKEALKEKMISKDEAHAGEEKIQKITDQYIKQVEKLLEDKEADLLSI